MMRVLGISFAGMMMMVGGCTARDVDATPRALAIEVDRCTVSRVFDACTLPTADPAILALAIDAHELAVAANDLSARTLRACQRLGRAYGILADDTAPDPQAMNDPETPGPRAEEIARVCAAVATHLRARTPPVRAEIKSERCFETTRLQCG